jgi:hypothetical protein
MQWSFPSTHCVQFTDQPIWCELLTTSLRRTLAQVFATSFWPFSTSEFSSTAGDVPPVSPPNTQMKIWQQRYIPPPSLGLVTSHPGESRNDEITAGLSRKGQGQLNDTAFKIRYKFDITHSPMHVTVNCDLQELQEDICS